MCVSLWYLQPRFLFSFSVDRRPQKRAERPEPHRPELTCHALHLNFPCRSCTTTINKKVTKRSQKEGSLQEGASNKGRRVRDGGHHWRFEIFGSVGISQNEVKLVVQFGSVHCVGCERRRLPRPERLCNHVKGKASLQQLNQFHPKKKEEKEDESHLYVKSDATLRIFLKQKVE